MSDEFHFDGNLLHVTGTKGREQAPTRKAIPISLSRVVPTATAGRSEVETGSPDEGPAPDVATVTELLREAESVTAGGGGGEGWSGPAGEYIVALERGETSDEATAERRTRSCDRTAQRLRPRGVCDPTSFPVHCFGKNELSDHHGMRRTISAFRAAIRWC